MEYQAAHPQSVREVLVTRIERSDPYETDLEKIMKPVFRARRLEDGRVLLEDFDKGESRYYSFNSRGTLVADEVIA